MSPACSEAAGVVAPAFVFGGCATVGRSTVSLLLRRRDPPGPGDLDGFTAHCSSFGDLAHWRRTPSAPRGCLDRWRGWFKGLLVRPAPGGPTTTYVLRSAGALV